jgi:CHAT domain-containing protein
LPVLNEVLDYSKKYQTRLYEDSVYLALGKLHESSGAFDKAIEAYQQSLMVAQAITDRDVEAKALKGLMSAWRSRGNAQLGIFYGKQAVNKYQELRGSIRSLRRETQNVYRDKVTDTYRELADLLIGVGHLREAEQVLAMLKEQEAFEFVRRDAGEAEDLLTKKIVLDAKEQKEIAEYVRLSNELTAKSQQADALYNKPDRSQSEEAEYQRLKKEVDDATAGFIAFFKRLESEFTKKTEDSGTITAQSIDSVRAQLRTAGPGVVLVSTYLLAQRYRAIVSTGRTMVDRKKEYQPSNLDGEQVNNKIMEFKRTLQNPRLDPRPLGKELYDIFFKPIERDIENARATTLLWSLDGPLRYIPVGALYDGRQFLAERYQNVFVTLGRTSDLFDEPPRRVWRVLGLGVSKQYKNFSELPSVPFELRTIVRDERVSQDNQGVLAGIRLLDSEFTEQSFVTNLRPAKAFNVVHLATHFRLGSNLDNSGLLLGDGEILSLYTINKDSDFDFKNIELLTLSACETGVTIGDSNGGEVESFGMIAQKNGAKAILATLWKVADRSTAILMSEFYRLRKTNPRLSKSQALQMAQKQMIEGKLQSTVIERRRDTGEIEQSPTNAPRYVTDAKRPYAHPYYWAPFVLIGNWR